MLARGSDWCWLGYDCKLGGRWLSWSPPLSPANTVCVSSPQPGHNKHKHFHLDHEMESVNQAVWVIGSSSCTVLMWWYPHHPWCVVTTDQTPVPSLLLTMIPVMKYAGWWAIQNIRHMLRVLWKWFSKYSLQLKGMLAKQFLCFLCKITMNVWLYSRELSK